MNALKVIRLMLEEDEEIILGQAILAYTQDLEEQPDSQERTLKLIALESLILKLYAQLKPTSTNAS